MGTQGGRRSWLGTLGGWTMAASLVGCEALGFVDANVDSLPDASVEHDAASARDARTPRERDPRCDVQAIDPEVFPACECGGSRCVPTAAVPEVYRARLDSCDDQSLCVPDEWVRTHGLFTPEACISIGGLEGRCMSRCLPEVASLAAYLPEDGCPETHLCTPCIDPRSGASTGVCELPCDPGPSEIAEPAPRCCGERGSCIDRAIVPDEHESALLACSDDPARVCVPDVLVERESTPLASCTAYHHLDLIELVSLGRGVCVPDCLAVDMGRLARSSCDVNERCVPCADPRSGASTGLCP